jgi:hypothetical protein
MDSKVIRAMKFNAARLMQEQFELLQEIAARMAEHDERTPESEYVSVGDGIKSVVEPAPEAASAASPSDAVKYQPRSMQSYLDTYHGRSSPWSDACHEGMARTLYMFAEALRTETQKVYKEADSYFPSPLIFFDRALSNLLPEVPR